jgi:adenosylcobinamide-GDP ribazoletransferase
VVQGDAIRRREVLKDSRIGIGGLGALFVVYAPALAALVALVAASPLRAAIALVAAEVAVRSTMLLTLALGKPADTNSSSTPFVRALYGDRRTVAVVLALLVPTALLALLGFPAVLAAVAVPLVAALVLRVAGDVFGGISGDLSGAGGEATRMVVLVTLTATI